MDTPWKPLGSPRGAVTIAIAFTSLGTFIATGEGNESLVAGLAAGWAAAVAANAVLVAIYSFSASRALEE